MKNLILILAIFMALCIYPFVNVNSNAQLPPSKTTGAPGETTCAQGAGCHGSTSIQADSELNLDFGGMTAYDGSTTTLTVSIDAPSSNKFGFEITALDENDMKAGSFTTSASNVFLQTNMVQGNEREYVSQFGASSTNSWTFQWTSPSTDVGDITFYLVGNAANSNGSPDENDIIYVKTFTLGSGVTSVGAQEIENIKFYPNPTQDVLFIDDLAGQGLATISDLNGKVLKTENITSTRLEIETSNLPEGTYILSLQSEENIKNDKFVINR